MTVHLASLAVFPARPAAAGGAVRDYAERGRAGNKKQQIDAQRRQNDIGRDGGQSEKAAGSSRRSRSIRR
jgi:hypothetical protein